MAFPDFPPPAQLDAESAGLSGTLVTALAVRTNPPFVDEFHDVPVEYTDHDGFDYILKDGYFLPDELAAWHAQQEPEEPEEPEEPAEPEPVDPAAQRVADLLGRGTDPQTLALASQAVPIITAMTNAYTRGGGFTEGQPNDEVAAVITTASARLMGNPEQLRYGVADVQMNDRFDGFNLAELFVLNRYRRRAQ